ncbi:uncharacterized protein COLE_02559 [Cutaneotrichosporon oleaginosum]|nr:hypothetical protein COLE_02559 [Cutaneotrichosporon oleaginosum]
MPPAPQHSSSRHYYSRSSSQDYDGGDHFRSRSHQDRSSARPGSSRQGTPVRDTFKILPPRREYILYSCEPLHSPEVPVPKLLVLDLNGALVYRTERGGSPRVAYPRPFLANFLSYVFGNDPDGRGYEVLVWSSAQPHNVRNMVESTFEPSLYKGSRLLDVWARDKMGLSANAYGQKVQTVKDLRKVTNVYNMYSEKTTVLLDDSPLKAIHQPWSQVVIPEFDRPEFTQARSAAQRLWEEAETRGATTTALDDGSTEPEMDNILLGVIGILEAMRDVDNVPAWVRAGNLSSPEHPLQEVPSMSVTLADLPTHDTFVPWFKDGEAHKYWIERGKEALARRGIPVSHGLMPDGHGATSTRIEDIERVAERKRTATLERIAERTRTAELERMDGLDCARPDGSASQPIAIHSDVEEEDDDTSDDGTPKQTKKVSKRKLKKKAEKRAWKERVKLAEAKAQADAEAGVGDGGQARGAREDSVATVIDAPRDDLPPGIEPVPIVEHITGRKQDSTLGRAAVAPAPFYVQRPAPPTRHAYGTRSQSAAAKVTATAPADNSSPTFSPSPKPREREYSPSKPVY